MKFTIQREALLKPLNQVVGVVERRQTLPVLSNLLVVAKEGELSVTGTDLEVEMVARLETTVKEEGDITLPARKFFDICRALPEGAEITVGGKDGKAVINAGRSRFTLATLPASEFPVIEDVEVGDSVSVDQHALKDLIERTAFAMAHQDVRYYLNGLLVELDSNRVRTVATDGHRLAVCDLETAVEVKEARQIIVPRKGIMELQRLLDGGEEPVTLELGKNHVRVRRADAVFTSKLIDGRFPDYQAVIPAQEGRQLTLDRSTFREALQRAAILSSEKVRGVKLELAPGTLTIIAHNPEQEEAVEEMEIEYDGEALAVGFNVQYLQDALAALEGESVLMFLRDANSSCLMRETDTERCRHVVMPLRL
jgi:DNA polymerase-3 subunit beta